MGLAERLARQASHNSGESADTTQAADDLSKSCAGTTLQPSYQDFICVICRNLPVDPVVVRIRGIPASGFVRCGCRVGRE